MLVVFEGIDGSGKGTQAAMLCEFLQGRQIFPSLHKYPTENAKAAHAHLRGEASSSPEELFSSFTKDIKNEQAILHKEISSGKFVLLDRYVFSTVAYQGGALGYERTRDAIKTLNFLQPDAVLLFDFPVQISLARKGAQKTPDKFEEDTHFLEGVRSRYIRMAQEGFLCGRWHVIDASKNRQEVFENAKECLLGLL